MDEGAGYQATERMPYENVRRSNTSAAQNAWSSPAIRAAVRCLGGESLHPSPNGVKLVRHRCKIACVARPGQQVAAGDRLPDRIGIGVLARVFPPELVDRVVDEAGVREQRKRTLPARVVVYYLLAMVLFFQSGYGEVWNKLVAGLDWARRFRARVELGMQPSPAAITYARQRLGWQVMARLLEETAGPLAGQERQPAFVSGMRMVAIDGMCLDLPDTGENGAEFGYPGNDGGRGPFPQIRVVGAGECGSRSVLGAETSPLATGEQPLARRLLARLSPGDLLLADRNFLSHGLLDDVLAAGLHVLWRAKSDVAPLLEVLPDILLLRRERMADRVVPAISKRADPGPAPLAHYEPHQPVAGIRARLRTVGARPKPLCHLLDGLPGRHAHYADRSQLPLFRSAITIVLNPNAWSAIPDGQFGANQSSIRSFRGFRQPEEDANIGRNFRLTERTVLQIRAEWTNVFNRLLLPQPNTAAPYGTRPTQVKGISTGGFGTVIPTANNGIASMRSGQLVVRLTF